MDRRLRIFVVEDNDDFYDVLETILTQLPRVSVVGRALESDTAVRLITSQQPDLAIVDLNLARGSGIDVIRFVRASHSPPKLLATSDSDGYRAAVSAGANWFYPKATGLNDLLNRVTWLQVELFGDGPDWHGDCSRLLSQHKTM